MGPDKADKEHLALVIHCDDETLFIATDVKHDAVVFQDTCVTQLGFQFWGRMPGSFARFRIPGFEWPLGISILGCGFPKFPQGPFRYDSHGQKYRVTPFWDQDHYGLRGMKDSSS